MRLSIQEQAERDILLQIEWYAGKGLLDIARQFAGAVAAALEALSATPNAGSPKAVDHPTLAGLRHWPISGFVAVRIYYIMRPDLVLVLRVLHGKRDVGTVLGEVRLDET